MRPFICLNSPHVVLPGADATISILDHGLLYGDGLFETLRVHEGEPLRVEAHLTRLRASAAQIRLELPWPDNELAKALISTCRANELGEGALRLTVTRGEGPPVPDLGNGGQAFYFVTARDLPPPRERPLLVCFAGRHPRAFIPGIKSLSYLPFLMARDEAKRRGCDEGLLLWDDRIVEGATTNVFGVRSGALITPNLECGCLPGVMRAAVLHAAAEIGLKIAERPISRDELTGFAEVFLTNSVTGLAPVGEVEGVRIGDGAVGPITRRLCDALPFQRRHPQAPEGRNA
jgi:branched-subunit amino acid aminotransferase/4-amino-4-deoxychorismate lyase